MRLEIPESRLGLAQTEFKGAFLYPSTSTIRFCAWRGIRASDSPMMHPGISAQRCQNLRLPPALMQLRGYQEGSRNGFWQRGMRSLFLPTGAGKTLIASELIRRLGPQCLFLVPTCLLVEQQSRAIRDWTRLQVAEFMGGVAIPQQFDVLASTPKAFHMAQAKGITSFLWDAFKLVVFDEVHHVLKS